MLHSRVKEKKTTVMCELYATLLSNLLFVLQNGWTALNYACVRGSVKIVKLLLSHEVDPNSQDEVKCYTLSTARHKTEYSYGYHHN